MKKIPVLAFIIWLVVSGSVYAQMDTAFIKTTHLFSVKGNESLYLDQYAAREQLAQPAPCVIFVFGGAFARGSRDVPKYMPYFN